MLFKTAIQFILELVHNQLKGCHPERVRARRGRVEGSRLFLTQTKK